jgi:hypothetical protein
VRLVRHFKDHLDVAIPTAGTFESSTKLIKREGLSTGPDQRLQVKLGTGVARNGDPLVPAMWVVGCEKAADSHSPAELPRFAKGLDRHGNKMRT